jgi:hypothetical protein
MEDVSHTMFFCLVIAVQLPEVGKSDFCPISVFFSFSMWSFLSQPSVIYALHPLQAYFFDFWKIVINSKDFVY